MWKVGAAVGGGVQPSEGLLLTSSLSLGMKYSVRITKVEVCMQKERRMREEIRSQKCIVKKLKKHVERRWDRETSKLSSQVELRLVWRVLNMSRLSQDRLVWCQKKLDSISFVGRKVEREPSFLLFPC